jgi:hypothetical protein
MPPPGVASAPPGVLTGNFRYGRADAQTEFNLTGAALPLESVARIQTARRCKAPSVWSICGWVPT